MLKSRIIISILSFSVLIGCTTIRNTERIGAQPKLSGIDINGKLYAAVFQQRAAEYQALCQQAYNIARLRLDMALNKQHLKSLAIVTDIDETFLDNSPYAVKMSREGKLFDAQSWNEWTSKASAKPLMGSLDFFKYAVSKGVSVFYVTNRYENDRQGTLKNLKQLGYPCADEEHLITRTSESSKEMRRQAISKNYEIVLLLGDNLSDFSSVFDKKNEADRLKGVLQNAQLFGDKFIVLPNTGYGDWESALLDYNYDRPQAQKDSIYNNSVIGY